MDSVFKQQIRADFDSILLCAGEFGRVCSWNDEPLKIVEDARTDLQQYEAQGVNTERKIIYCRDVDLSPHPSVMEEVTFDDDCWTVYDVKKSFAYLMITLERRVV